MLDQVVPGLQIAIPGAAGEVVFLAAGEPAAMCDLGEVARGQIGPGVGRTRVDAGRTAPASSDSAAWSACASPGRGRLRAGFAALAESTALLCWCPLPFEK
jgi:hypothetical protein